MSASTAVVEREEQAPVVSETAAILSMIERAARDPSIDINKLQQLMTMRERVEARSAEREYDAAMTDAQQEMRRVATDALNPQTKSKYASFAALDRALRPIYTKHGFSLSYDTADGAPPDSIRIVCKVAHRSGHRSFPHIDMPADGKGAKGGDVMTKTHAAGSAISYGRRYLLSMIFNIAVGADDDGNAASNDPITEAQASNLRTVIEEVGADIEKFCKAMGVGAIPHIPANQYDRAILMLNQKRSAKVCPHCKKSVANLENHIREKHPETEK